MPKTTSITEAVISLIQTMEDVVRRFGDRIERGPEVRSVPHEAAKPRRVRDRSPRTPAAERAASAPRAPASGAPKVRGTSEKLRSALKNHWANMTPEERAARIAKMRAGHRKGRARGTTS